MKSKTIHIKFSSLYFFQFAALGAFLPLFAVYLKSIGMSGTQIGVLTALGSLLTVISAPFWGYVADRTNKHQLIYLLLLSSCIITAFLIPTAKSFIPLFIILIFFHFGLSAINPLLDGITLNTPVAFGKVRLWGSIGFGVASLLVGYLANATSLSSIFYIYMAATFITGLLLLTISVSIDNHQPIHSRDFKLLFTNKSFMLFLLLVFLIGSTIGGHNVYFGLLFEETGGNLALIGLAFLLFTFSEAPFMHLTSKWVETYGVMNILLTSAILLTIRWFFYGLGLSPTILLITFFSQGLAYALFLIGTAQYIKQYVSNHIRTTAMTLFSAVGFGVGGIFINYFSGLLYDQLNAKSIYLLYSGLCAFAVFVVIRLKKSHGIL